MRASPWLTSQHWKIQEKNNSSFIANGFILSVTTQPVFFRFNCTATVLLYSLFNSYVHYSFYKGSIRRRVYTQGNYSPHFRWSASLKDQKPTPSRFHMAAACLSITRHRTFWRLCLCQTIEEPHLHEKAESNAKSHLSEQSMTCTHDKRLKRDADADPQPCSPTKRGRPVYRRSTMMGGAPCIWNATWPKPSLTVWSSWSLICFEPCNARPAICNQATTTSMRL